MGVLGIDVSHYQGKVDWFAVHSSGAAFAFAKATEGLSVVDPLFASNWAGMRQSHLYRGAYHFGHPGTDPETQAAHFHSVVGELSWADLPPVLDIETNDGQLAPAVAQWVLRFVAHAESLFARPIMIYTGGFWRNKLGDPIVPELAQRPLWVANYRGGEPVLPRTWSKWTFWQYSDGTYGQPGPAPGVHGPCDRNRFVGDLTQLAALCDLRLPPLPAAPEQPAPAKVPWPGVYFVWPNKTATASESVHGWQQRMLELGYQIRVDGLYGPASKAGCMSFQRDHGLNVDGIVGPQCWSAVFAAS